jgi:hypothetical protein
MNSFVKCLEAEGIEYIFGLLVISKCSYDIAARLENQIHSCTRDFHNNLEKAKESISVAVIISIGVDYSRNRILLDDNFIGEINYDN